MRFKIGSKVYEAASVERLSMGHLLRIQSETEAIGVPMTWPEVKALLEEVSALDEAEADNHPQALLVIGLTIWASRLNAGEDMSLADAVDFPMSALEFLPEPKDHKQKADPTKPRAASARGSKRQGAEAK